MDQSSTDFGKAWDRFSKNAGENPASRENALKVLQTITKLAFGQDEAKKTVLVNGGALELITTCSRPYYREDDAIVAESLKAIRCCVVRNPVGRAKCRSARILIYMHDLLLSQHLLENNTSCRKNNAVLAEDVLTTIAAVCIGDDLNSLQATIQLKELIEEVSAMHADNSTSSLQNKVAYLRSLFLVTENEQLTAGEVFVRKEFFDDLVIAEQAKITGNEAFSKNEFAEAEEAYTKSLNLVVVSEDSVLPCIKEFAGTLYSNRSACHMNLQQYQKALADADLVLKFRPGWTKGFFRRAQALAASGRVDDAKEALGKGLVVDPGSGILRSELEKLGGA